MSFPFLFSFCSLHNSVSFSCDVHSRPITPATATTLSKYMPHLLPHIRTSPNNGVSFPLPLIEFEARMDGRPPRWATGEHWQALSEAKGQRTNEQASEQTNECTSLGRGSGTSVRQLKEKRAPEENRRLEYWNKCGGHTEAFVSP